MTKAIENIIDSVGTMAMEYLRGRDAEEARSELAGLLKRIAELERERDEARAELAEVTEATGYGQSRTVSGAVADVLAEHPGGRVELATALSEARVECERLRGTVEAANGGPVQMDVEGRIIWSTKTERVAREAAEARLEAVRDGIAYGKIPVFAFVPGTTCDEDCHADMYERDDGLWVRHQDVLAILATPAAKGGDDE